MPSLRSRLPVELGSVGDPKAQVGRLHRLAVAGGPGWGLVRLLRKGKVRVWLLELPVRARSRGSMEGATSIVQSAILYQAPTAPGSVVCIRGLGLNITFWLIMN